MRRAAARFGVGVSTAVLWVRRWRETGERTARKQGHPIRSKLDAHEAYLLGLIEQTVDITLDEMRHRLAEERGVPGAATVEIREHHAIVRCIIGHQELIELLETH